MKHLPIRRQRGFTLVELSVVAGIAAVLVGAAIPSLKQVREQRHLEGAAAQLETDFQFARSAAVARGQVVRVSFQADSSGSCYVVHTGDANDCSCMGNAAAVCSADAEPLHMVRYSAADPVRLQSNSRSVGFEPVRGTVTPTATVQVVAAGGAAINQVINVMGRVRSCSPTGLAGYKRC